MRGFLNPLQVDHVLGFWRTHRNKTVRHYDKSKLLRLGCPDVSVRSSDVESHHNYFWNKPLDMFTYVTGWRLQALRNRVEGNPPNKDLLPHYDQNSADSHAYCIASYRVTLTTSGGRSKAHVDWPLDHSRVQLALMLSNHGQDYRGGLFLDDRFRGGAARNLCEAENLRAGDLVVLRYGQPHGVDPVTTAPGGSGYCRLLMPHELIPKRSRWRRFLRSLGRRRHKALPTSVPAGEAGSYYDDDVGRLMNIAIREGFEPAEVFYHRGLWGRFKTFAAWQMDVLQEHGLRPQHHFLDIGCGVMRLGMGLIPFLDDDRYCGVDPLPAYIKLARVYMREVVETTKPYHLSCDGNFRFDVFGRKFDFAMAQSVFTHMSFEQIERCLASLKGVMKPGGRFLFTIILSRDDEVPFIYAYNTPMTRSAHEDVSFYEELGRKIGFKVQLIGRQGHPTQELCVATF